MLAPKTTVIVNPNSQGGKLGRRWAMVSEIIQRAFPFDAAITAQPGDATLLAREALRQGAERIVAIGGDGTVNEVVNGFFDEAGTAIRPEATFALIPFGTGGDFRRSIGLPTELVDAVAVAAKNVTKTIDIGRLAYTRSDGTPATRMFANITSFGVSGVVDKLVNESGKKLGRLSFMLATARATWGYTNKRVELTFDGQHRVEATISTVAVANGKYFGGAMMVAPDAELDDGLFDVIAMGDLGFGDLLASGRKIYKGTHLAMDKVTARRATTVTAEPIDASDEVLLDVDGENLGRLPATFTIVPQALRLVVPGP